MLLTPSESILPLSALLIRVWIPLAILMRVLWARQTRTLFANAVDAAWALSFTFAAFVGVYFGIAGGQRERIWLVAFCLAGWSLRLGLYLLKARVLGAPRDADGKPVEDTRYRALRARFTQTKFFYFYQMQSLLVTVLSIPVFVAMSEPTGALRALDLVGVGIWLVAWIGESLSDLQLSRFKRDPANRGRTCDQGLWKYTRHPNYFFEWLHWWAYVAIGITAPNWWLTLIGPALMLFFLLKLTGVRPSELQSLRNRPDYADYQRRTSMFVPWFPKKN